MRKALALSVVFFAVWIGIGALQGEDLEVAKALAIAICAGVGSLVAQRFSNRQTGQR